MLSLSNAAPITPLIAAVIGGAIALIGNVVIDRWNLRGVRSQIGFLLTHLAIDMAMVRDFPEYPTIGFEDYLTRLRERVFSADGARAVCATRLQSVLNALSAAEQSHAAIERMRQNNLPPVEKREYLSAAGRRAFRLLYAARASLRYNEFPLLRPVDPFGLHNWQAGTPITVD